MSKIKSVSFYTRQDGETGSWDGPTPLGADIENIDITDQVSNTIIQSSEIDDLLNNDVVVSNGDTGATAWTKFNKVRNIIKNIASNLKSAITETENKLTSVTYTFNNEWLSGFYLIASGLIEVQFPQPPFATGREVDLTSVEVYIPNYAWQSANLTDTSRPRVSVGVTPWGYTHVSIPISMFSTDQQTKIASTPGNLLVRIQGSITFS